MSVVGGILSPMDSIIYLIVGALLGVAAGFFFGKSRSSGPVAGASGNLEASLADARARVELLTNQVSHLKHSDRVATLKTLRKTS
jgi:hypothetical protein